MSNFTGPPFVFISMLFSNHTIFSVFLKIQQVSRVVMQKSSATKMKDRLVNTNNHASNQLGVLGHNNNFTSSSIFCTSTFWVDCCLFSSACSFSVSSPIDCWASNLACSCSSRYFCTTSLHWSSLASIDCMAAKKIKILDQNYDF